MGIQLGTTVASVKFGNAAASGVVVAPRPVPTFTISTVGAAPILDKETYINASYEIAEPGAPTVAGTLRIRGRGNWTWTQPKKPYRLNFDTATAPLGMTAVQKNWALLASYEDPRKIAHILGLTLGANMSGLDWTPQFRPVEVTLNGDYLGLYLLTDLVRRETGRVEGSGVGTSGDALTGTWLAEISRRYGSEGAPGFTTPRDTMIQFEDPEVDLASVDPTVAAQAQYFRDWMEDFEDALYGASWLDPQVGYARLVDMESFADWWLVNELGSNQDSWFESSVKLWKERDSLGGKLHMGPLWDFGISFGNVVNISHDPTGWNTIAARGQGPGATWIVRMRQDPAFQAVAAARWAHLKTRIPSLLTAVDGYVTMQAAAIDRDETRWSFPHTNLATARSFVKTWITQRVEWITANL